MPSLDQIRDAGERELTAKLKQLNQRHRREVLAAVDQYGSVAQIPDSFWQRLQREIEEEEVAALLFLILAADDSMSTEIERQGVRATGVGASALTAYGRAAGKQAQRSASQYIDTTRSRLEEVELAGESVSDSVADVITDERAEGASVTTTTEGISVGQRGAAERAEAEGEGSEEKLIGQRVEIELVWETRKDERVCPVCSPLQGKTEGVWSLTFPEGPPGHPRCRCSLRSRVSVYR